VGDEILPRFVPEELANALAVVGASRRHDRPLVNPKNGWTSKKNHDLANFGISAGIFSGPPLFF